MTVIKDEKLRSVLKILLPFFLIPLVIIAGATVFDSKKYAVISLLVTVLSLILFMSSFEQKKAGTRRLVIVSVMVALSVVGRFIPFFKPVTAFCIIVGMTFGGQAGFLTGALSALVSNFYFGQGPWTPFQMFAWGLIGLFAGILSKPLNKNRIFLLFYGVIAGALFSLIMDVWTVLWYNGSFELSLYLTALSTALPYTILYSVSNLIFLILLAKPFCEKLNRVKIKYNV